MWQNIDNSKTYKVCLQIFVIFAMLSSVFKSVIIVAVSIIKENSIAGKANSLYSVYIFR